MSRAYNKWVAGVLCLWLVAACDGGDTDPAAKPDTAQGQDVAVADDGSDAGGTSDGSADSVADSAAGGSDAVAEVSPPEDTAGTTCATPCVDSDNNPCTVATCQAGQCVQQTVANGSSCEDGNPCTTADTCQAGQCTASSAAGTNTCSCEANADCAALDDALLCNGQFYCDKSAFPFTCKVNPASIPPCDAQTPPSSCLTGACAEPTVGGGKAQCIWKPLADGSACDDGNPLTAGDSCVQGVCLAGQFIGTCQGNGDCAQYEDGNLCNGQLFCNKAKGQCQLNPATVIACPTSADTVCAKNTCEPKSGKCSLVPNAEGQGCDDGNDCTSGEVCQAGLCSGATNVCNCAADADCATKEDGNLCNGTLFCNLQVGQCQVNPATVISCGEAAAPCQLLACEPSTGQCIATPDQDGTPCNADNTLCTVADSCQQGSCKAGENLCKCAKSADCGLYEDGDQCNGQLYCNLQIGACELNPATVVTCDSDLDTPCAKQVCVPLSGACTAVVQNDGGGCDDGDSCTLGDVCAAGSCEPGASVCACQQDADCAADEDGNFCNGTLYCDKISATCKLNPASIVSCADALPGDCTAVTCEPATGLCVDVSLTAGTGCDDGDPCTIASKCTATGQCSGGFDSCGCSSDLECSQQDDGDACNGVVRCDFAAFPVAQCALVAPEPCVAGPCEVAKCVADTGACVVGPAPLQATCDDGDPCTLASACSETGCIGVPLDCDDGEPCTTDWCGNGVCNHQALADKLPCDDNDLCTPVDYCAAGKCTHTTLVCDDANPCSDDGCKSGVCVFAPNTNACNDNNDCTQNDVCSSGACGGAPVLCTSPPGPCLVGSCGPGGTCVYSASFDGAACEDGKPCSASAACQSGQCSRTATKVCDDGDPCTTDPACDDQDALGCVVPAQADGNPLMYWTTTVSGDADWWSSLTWHPKLKNYGALSTTATGNDPRLRIWPGPGQAPTDFDLTYPGSNVASGLVDYSQSGWALVGENGSAIDSSAPKKPLLMLVGPDGALLTVSTGLGEGLQLSAIAHFTSSDTNTDKRYMIAGSLAPGGNTYATTMWIGELDWSDPGVPKLVRSATCGTASSSGLQIGSLTWHGTHLARLAGGGWALGGYGRFDNFEYATQFPALCHFDATLTPVGEPIQDSAEAGTRQVIAREDGGYWWLTTEGKWRAYTAEGYFVAQADAGWAAAYGVAQGNAMWLASNNDGIFGVALMPFAGSNEGAAEAFSGTDGFVLGLVKDDTGFALLYQDPAGLMLQHMDSEFYQSCQEATDCLAACEGGDACNFESCNQGQCAPMSLYCDDGNDCTADSCEAGGCRHDLIEQVSCNDDQPCTILDSCVNGQCKGQTTLGTTATTVSATETLVDGVIHGDGLLVLGNRQEAGQTQAFWRLYAANREVSAEGMITTGTAVALARYKPEFTGDGSFGPAAKVAAVVRGATTGPSLWYLDPGTLQAEQGPSLATQDAAMHSLIQETDGAVMHLTSGPSGWNVYRYVQDQQPTVFLTNAVPDVRDAHLLPFLGDWIVVQVDNTAAGKRALFWHFDATGGQVGYPVIHELGPQSLTTDPICPYAARVPQGVQLVCAESQAVFYTPQEPAFVTPMPDWLAFNWGASPGPLLATSGQAAVSLVKTSQDGTFTLFPHDGFFNAGPGTQSVLATTAPVLAANSSDIWFVTETETGNTRQVAVHHLDRYGNNSCEKSGGCGAIACEDANSCTIEGCTAGACSSTGILPDGNCGSEGPCSNCGVQ